jgi:hypothetical protein
MGLLDALTNPDNWGGVPPRANDDANSPQNVLARSISRLGSDYRTPGWSVTANPVDDDPVFRQRTENGWRYPSAMSLSRALLSGDFKDSLGKEGVSPAAAKQAAALVGELEQLPAPEGGWTDQDIERLGRNPKPFELSEAGRARDSHLQDQELLSQALSGDRRGIYSNAGARAAAEGRRLGESGYGGALANPEYAAGNALVNYMQPMADAAWSQFSDQAPLTKGDETGYYHPRDGWIPDSSWNPMKAKSIAAALIAAPASPFGAANKYLFHYLPSAKDRADVLTAANKVDPILPAGYDRASGNEQLRQYAGDNAREANFDEWYRKQYGEYPSYALSSAAVFGNGLIDPSLLAGVPAARAATGTGVGLMKLAPVASPLYRYGKSVAGAASSLAKHPVLAGAVKEGVEEFPTNIGVMSALSFGPEASGQATVQDNGLYSRPHVPGFGDYGQGGKSPSMFGGGENRTDLVKPQYDEEGNFLGYGHESSEEFADRMNSMETQGAALRQGIPNLMDRIKASMIHAPF